MKSLLIRLAAVLLFAVPAIAQHDIFPLAKGAAWTYEGTVRWASSGFQEHSKRIRWRMEVLDVTSGPEFHAALIQGAPWELAWYDPPRTVRRTHIILVTGGATYLLDCSHQDTFAILKHSGLTKELREQLAENVWYREPISPDGLYCAPDQSDRRDRMYCWAVDEVKRQRITGVSGVAPSEQQVITLAFRTLPDHQFVDFAVGIGILRYRFAHHGTLSEADVRLVEFRRGETNP